MSVDIYIEAVDVKPAYGIRAVRVPGGGEAQCRLRDMLTPIGVKVSLWDGAVEQLTEPVNGAMYQWRSLKVEGVYRSAQIGDWIVVHLGGPGYASVQTMTDEEFRKIYKVKT